MAPALPTVRVLNGGSSELLKWESAQAPNCRPGLLGNLVWDHASPPYRNSIN